MPVYVNHVPNPSAEGATASLENATGATVTIVTTSAADWPADGTSSYSVVASGSAAASSRLRLVDRAATVAGTRWHVRAKVRAHSGNSGTRDFSARGVSYDIAPGAAAGTATPDATPQTFSLAPGAIADVDLSFLASAGALSAGFELTRETGSGATGGDGFHVDMLAFVPEPDADADVNHFNPDADGLATWDGTANASTSTLYVPAVLLEPLDPDVDDVPAPGVHIEVADLPPWADNVIVRVDLPDADEEPTRIVRDANGAAALATFLVDDFEAAIGDSSAYTVEVRTGAVRLGTTDPDYITLPASDPLTVWIADPLDPSSALRATISGAFADEVGKEREAEFASPGGVTDGSVMMAGAMLGYVGLNLEFYTPDAATTRAFKRLRNQTPIAVLRTAPPVPVPRTLYVAMLNPRSRLLVKESGFTRWAWTSRQVISPKIGVVVPLHTYEDYMAFYPTYAAAMAVFTDYVDAIRNAPPAV